MGIINEGVYAQGIDVRDIQDYLGNFLAEIPSTQRTAEDMLTAAETSGFDYGKIEAAFRRHQAALGAIYGDFTAFRSAVDQMAKEAGVSTRKPPVKGGKYKSKDISAMSAEELEDDAKRIMVSMNGVHKEIRKTGGEIYTMVKEMAMVDAGGSDPPSDVQSEVETLVRQRYWPFRDSVYLNFGMIGGLIKRLNARADMVGIPQISKNASEDEQRAHFVGLVEENMGLVNSDGESSRPFEVLDAHGVAISRFGTYKEAMAEARSKGGTVNLNEGKSRLVLSLPWARDKDVPDI